MSCFTSTCVILITFGTLIAELKDFSTDYEGYIIVIIYHALTVTYNKMTETFKKNTGVPNLKFLIYNSYLSCPISLILIFLTGEYRRLIIIKN